MFIYGSMKQAALRGMDVGDMTTVQLVAVSKCVPTAAEKADLGLYLKVRPTQCTRLYYGFFAFEPLQL